MVYGLPSKQTVNGVGGRLHARDVRVGCRLWALDGERAVRTTVQSVDIVTTREIVDVVTGHVTFSVAPDQLPGTPDGWVHARDAAGNVLAWTHARKLCRERLTVRPGYAFGYMIGAGCSDGTVGRNYVSLIVNDEGFASRYARCLTESTGLPARLEEVTRPSGYLKREVPGFRVRVVSSYLADLMRQYVGGDAHHLRQRSPRVVLRTGRRSRDSWTATPMVTVAAPRPGAGASWSVPTSRSSRTSRGWWAGDPRLVPTGRLPTWLLRTAGRHAARSKRSSTRCTSERAPGSRWTRFGGASRPTSRSPCTATGWNPTRASW